MGTTLKIDRSRDPSAPAPPRPSLLSDEALAARVGQGDERAFEQLYARYRSGLHRYCASILRQPEDAEEALQSTMLAAYLALAGGGRDVAVRPWIYRIAHNHCVDMLRRRPAERPAAFTGDEVLNAPGVAERVELADDLRRLRQDLLALPVDQRGALVMRELSGLSHAQIGLVLEERPEGVKQLIYQARAGLHAMADGRDLDCATVRRRISDGDGRVLRARGLGAHLRACAACRGFREATARGPARLAALSPVAPAAIGERLLDALRSLLGAGGAGGGAGAVGSGASSSAIGLTAGAKIAAVVVAGLVGGSAVVAPVVLADRGHPDRPSPAPPATSSATGAGPATGSALPLASGAVADPPEPTAPIILEPLPGIGPVGPAHPPVPASAVVPAAAHLPVTTPVSPAVPATAATPTTPAVPATPAAPAPRRRGGGAGNASGAGSAPAEPPSHATAGGRGQSGAGGAQPGVGRRPGTPSAPTGRPAAPGNSGGNGNPGGNGNGNSGGNGNPGGNGNAGGKGNGGGNGHGPATPSHPAPAVPDPATPPPPSPPAEAAGVPDPVAPDPAPAGEGVVPGPPGAAPAAQGGRGRGPNRP